MGNYLFILDNGHGNDTAGKRSDVLPDGRQYFEYEMARNVVNLIAAKCTAAGLNTHILVPELNDISLGERVRRANGLVSPKRKILISIHSNAAINSGWHPAKGWEVYTTPGVTRSDKVAEVLHKHADLMWAANKTREDLSDGDNDKEAKFFIIDKSNMPAVLTENFFHTNQEETKKLLDPAFRNQIAEVHFKAMQEIDNGKIIG